MGLRQTFGLFFEAFEKGLGVTRTEFGLAIGIQMLFWGIFAPIFGLLADIILALLLANENIPPCPPTPPCILLININQNKIISIHGDS